MIVGLFSGPVQILSLYFILVALAYIESDGFRQQAPFLVSLPYLILALCTMNLTMPEKKRYLTTVWLLLAAISSYFVPTKRSISQLTSLIKSFGKTIYLLTFIDCVKRVWNNFAILLVFYYAFLIFYCVADLYYSIPVYVTFALLYLALNCITVGAASAVYKFGSKSRTYSNHAALIRFIGTLFSLLCSSFILINEFANRIHGFKRYIILLEYIAHSFMFLANEMAF